MADLERNTGAARVAADILLRGTGGRSVALRLPLPAIAGLVGEQIGLASPSFQDLELAPVCFRKARPQVNGEGVVTWELLVSATCVEALAGTFEGSQILAASALFAGAYGVVIDGVVWAIETTTSNDVDGSPCVYRLLLRRPRASS